MINKHAISHEAIARVRELNNGRERIAYVLTFGCQQNESDSERMRGIAEEMGYTVANTHVGADLIIVNTCAIREHAEMKALSMLGNFKEEKRKNPELIIGVVGCMAAEEHVVDMLKQKFHYVTFTLEPNMIHKLPDAVLAKLECGKRTFILNEDVGDIAEGLPCKRTQAHRAWVSIMYGCNNFCSYCIVPYTRGRERSRDSADILKECKALVEGGCREITLLGQNVNSYKSDMDFPTLLGAIASIDGDFIVRFMTSHPKDVSDKLIEVMAEYRGKVAPYFHLPLQSGSNKILKAMHRTYTRERFLEIVDKLRTAVPEICLSTDVIVGFPGESDEDFAETMDVLHYVKFDVVYSFRFSPRVGTPAAKMENTVPAEAVDVRMAELLTFQDSVSEERNQPYIGTVQRVLVDSVSKKSELGTYSARTDTNKLVHFTAKEARIGEFANVLIEKVGAYELLGKEI